MIDTELDFQNRLFNGWRFKTLLMTIMLSVIGYFLFTLWAGWDKVVQALLQVGWLGIGLSISLSLVNYLLRFSRWQLFLSALGHSIPWLSSLRIYFSGFALTTTPGKSGEAIRGVFLKDFGVPFRKSLGAFFAERFFDLVAVSILAVGGVWTYPSARWILVLVAAVLSFCVYAAGKHSWLHAIERMAKRSLSAKFAAKFARSIEFIISLIISFRCCFSVNILLGVLSLSVIAWGAEAASLYYLLHFLGHRIDFVTALFIYGFSLVIGGITLLPGGLGGAEATMLQLLLISGIGASEAVAITLVIRLTTLWLSVFLGFLFLQENLRFRIPRNRAKSIDE